MQLEIKPFGAYCSTKVFIINGIEAYSGDFGTKNDEDPENAEEYGCGDMRFTARPATDEVLRKYGITHAEYLIVAGQLESALSFGSCGWCV